MAELLLVNPRRRKRRKASSHRRKHRKTRARRRRKAVAIAKVNPRRRRRRSHRVRHHRRKRNPSVRGVINQIQPAVKAGLIGAAGGLGLSVGLGYLLDKLPVQLQSGYGLTAVKVLGALGVGILGGMVLKGKGNALAQGAMTVVVYDELKKVIMAQFPAVPLGEYMSMAPVVGYDEAAALEMDSADAEDMGEYLSGAGDYASDSDEAIYE